MKWHHGQLAHHGAQDTQYVKALTNGRESPDSTLFARDSCHGKACLPSRRGDNCFWAPERRFMAIAKDTTRDTRSAARGVFLRALTPSSPYRNSK